MKTIDLSEETPTLRELLEIASDENILLRTPEGREFVFAEVEYFDKEVELVRQHEELMQFLNERSQEKETYTLEQVREHLDAT